MIIAIIITAAVLLSVAVWLFLIAPKNTTEMNKYKTVRYAHRGLHGEVGGGAAENSITAFRLAVEHGYGIELDVRVSSDKEVVIFHDDTLKRVTGKDGRPEELTAKELSELSLLGTGDGVPTLREVLALVDGKVPLLVEIKESGGDHTVTEKCAEILREYKGDYIVESFNPLTLGVVKKLLPNVPRGFLSDKFTVKKKCRALKYRLTQRFLLNFIARPAFIAMEKKRAGMMPLPVLRALFRVPTLAWTITSQEEEDLAYKNGFDGVIFEQYIPGDKI